MATWQFDLTFVRADRKVHRLLDGTLAAESLTLEDYFYAQGHLTQFALPQQNFTPEWEIFGEADGNRIDIITEGPQTEISARIDTRTDADDFCNVVCDLAKGLECELLATELGCVLKPDKDALYGALMSSAAWRYALDPHAYLQALR